MVVGKPAGPRNRLLADATWPEVDTANRDVLIVPLGSTEQHGPHLPLDTDTYLACAVAERLQRARPESDLAPAMPLGASGEHSAFPGTISLGTEVLQLLLVELVRDASRHWRSLLVVNGHGGNLDALRGTQELCRWEGRRLGVVTLALPGMDGHAGHAETSMMLHLAPERVRLDLAEPGNVTRLRDLLPRLRTEGLRAVSPSGVLGDPTAATASRGEGWLNALAERVTAVHDKIAQRA